MGKTIDKKRIILASDSPRRKELLSRIVDDFDVISPQIDESVSYSMSPIDAVMYLAHQKAESVSKDNAGLIIAADTVVVLDGIIMGKPNDAVHAKKMLLDLSGKTHKVFTGICVFDTDSGKMICSYKCTDVTFAELTVDDVERYLSCNEYVDKAGAYAIQGKGARFVRSINGCYYNVVGLPINMLCDILNHFDFGG